MDNKFQPQLTGQIGVYRTAAARRLERTSDGTVLQACNAPTSLSSWNAIQTKNGEMPATGKDLHGNDPCLASASDLNDINVLVQNHRSSVLRYALSRLRDRDLAESVTQDCFMRAFRSRGDFRGECSIRTWLFVIAKNLIRDYTRTKRFRFWREANAVAVTLGDIHDRVASHQPTPEAELLATERLARMRSVVDSLPKRQNDILQMRFAEGMSLSEIARTTGMTMSATKSQLYRGIHTIRARTQDHAQPGIRKGTVRDCILLDAQLDRELESHRSVVG
jgi:RNA polymerase sigma-70 factor, ECF subfamily